MLAIHHNHESLQLLRECYSCLNLQQQQQKLMLRSRPICSRNSNLPLILSHRSVPPLQVESVCPPPLLLLLAPSIPPPLLPQSPLLMSLYWLPLALMEASGGIFTPTQSFVVFVVAVVGPPIPVYPTILAAMTASAAAPVSVAPAIDIDGHEDILART